MKKIILVALILSGCGNTTNDGKADSTTPKPEITQVEVTEINIGGIPVRRFCDRDTAVYVRGESIAVIPEDKYCSQNGVK